MINRTDRITPIRYLHANTCQHQGHLRQRNCPFCTADHPRAPPSEICLQLSRLKIWMEDGLGAIGVENLALPAPQRGAVLHYFLGCHFLACPRRNRGFTPTTLLRGGVGNALVLIRHTYDAILRTIGGTASASLRHCLSLGLPTNRRTHITSRFGSGNGSPRLDPATIRLGIAAATACTWDGSAPLHVLTADRILTRRTRSFREGAKRRC